MKGVKVVAVLILAAVLLGGCTAGPNHFQNVPGSHGTVAGFLSGYWHGLIAPITFIWSLFDPMVKVYEVHNNGAWYDFGFLLGACSSIGGCGTAKKKKQ